MSTLMGKDVSFFALDLAEEAGGLDDAGGSGVR